MHTTLKLHHILDGTRLGFSFFLERGVELSLRAGVGVRQPHYPHALVWRAYHAAAHPTRQPPLGTRAPRAGCETDAKANGVQAGRPSIAALTPFTHSPSHAPVRDANAQSVR